MIKRSRRMNVSLQNLSVKEEEVVVVDGGGVE